MESKIKDKVIKAITKTISQGWYFKSLDLEEIFDAGFKHGWDYKEEKVDKYLYDSWMSMVFHTPAYKLLHEFYKKCKFRKRARFYEIKLTYHGPDMNNDEVARTGDFKSRLHDVIDRGNISHILHSIYAVAWSEGYRLNPYESETARMFREMKENPLFQRKDLKPETLDLVRNLLKETGLDEFIKK